ncbi:MAG: beta-lactamase family protein [Candidatus Moduliflexus flocculans]|nr:beta-lactamase family protein [Candidatus Moduliflexus flocculans]
MLDGAKPANSAAVRVDAVPGEPLELFGRRLHGHAAPDDGDGGKALSRPHGRARPETARAWPTAPTSSRCPGSRRGVAATGHDPDGKPIPGRYHTYPEMAAAGLWTTPTDLARFLLEIRQALAGRSSVISAETARLDDDRRQRPATAWVSSLQRPGPAASFGHGGSNEGFRCQMTAFIADGHGAVIMTNADGGGRLASGDPPGRGPGVRLAVPISPR